MTGSSKDRTCSWFLRTRLVDPRPFFPFPISVPRRPGPGDISPGVRVPRPPGAWNRPDVAQRQEGVLSGRWPRRDPKFRVSRLRGDGGGDRGPACHAVPGRPDPRGPRLLGRGGGYAQVLRPPDRGVLSTLPVCRNRPRPGPGLRAPGDPLTWVWAQCLRAGGTEGGQERCCVHGGVERLIGHGPRSIDGDGNFGGHRDPTPPAKWPEKCAAVLTSLGAQSTADQLSRGTDFVEMRVMAGKQGGARRPDVNSSDMVLVRDLSQSKQLSQRRLVEGRIAQIAFLEGAEPTIATLYRCCG